MIHMVTTILTKLKLRFLSKQRRIYAVLEGKYKGEWLLKIKQDKENIIFFSLPDKNIRTIPTVDYEWGLQNKVLEPVDVLPKLVYNVCLAEYNLKATDVQKNNALNRRE
jgi:hypothetical protein